jgi:predicted metal-dependent HD superfamily phosphohydrolase
MPEQNKHLEDADSIDVSGALEYARRRMRHELPTRLTYHNYDHTFNEVLPASLSLGDVYHLAEDNMILLAIAAAYHDIGWIIQGTNHETIGVGIALEILPTFGFSNGAMDRIAGMIMATKLPQSPTNPLEEIMVDADLDVLGREDYWPRSEDLRLEMALRGEDISLEEWYQRQKGFLESHTYYTTAAQILRNKQKQQNLWDLKRRIAKLPGTDDS